MNLVNLTFPFNRAVTNLPLGEKLLVTLASWRRGRFSSFWKGSLPLVEKNRLIGRMKQFQNRQMKYMGKPGNPLN